MMTGGTPILGDLYFLEKASIWISPETAAYFLVDTLWWTNIAIENGHL